MTPDPDRVAAIIAEIAETEIAPHYKRLKPESVRAKLSPNDLVTIVDEAVERALREALSGLVPGAAFIGEEAAAADPSIVSKLRSDGAVWIVDPLDGTRNFVNGVDEFGTIVAYLENGQTLAGWIYAAPEKAMAIGVKGGGVTCDGEPVIPKKQKDEKPQGLRSVGWLKGEWKERLPAALKRDVVSKSGHCSAYGYLKLIRGEVDFKLSSRIHAWDHAPGVVMLEELGGAARWLDTGEPYRPQESRDHPLLAVAPGRDWEEIAERLLSGRAA